MEINKEKKYKLDFLFHINKTSVVVAIFSDFNRNLILDEFKFLPNDQAVVLVEFLIMSYYRISTA